MDDPAVLKETFETGGQNVIAGASNFVDDVLHHGGRPRQVDTTSFSLGKNLAATPGRVVMRNSLMELAHVRAANRPGPCATIVCSPPWINKYYIMDLAPADPSSSTRSSTASPCFCISYRKPRRVDCVE